MPPRCDCRDCQSLQCLMAPAVLQDELGWEYPIIWFAPWTDKVHYDGAGRLVGHALTVSVGGLPLAACQTCSSAAPLQ